jgi:hypothetical protein
MQPASQFTLSEEALSHSNLDRFCQGLLTFKQTMILIVSKNENLFVSNA